MLPLGRHPEAIRSAGGRSLSLVFEMPDARENHGDVAVIGSFDYLRIPDGSSWLDDGAHPAIRSSDHLQ